MTLLNPTRDEIIRRLERLTPQGSEFYNDPDRCFAHIEELIYSGHEAKKEVVRQKRKVSDMLAFIEKVAQWDFEGIGDYDKLYNMQKEAFELIKKVRGL